MTEANNIPEVLISICNYLKRGNVPLSADFNDGRINSSINEKELLEKIRVWETV